MAEPSHRVEWYSLNSTRTLQGVRLFGNYDRWFRHPCEVAGF